MISAQVELNGKRVIVVEDDFLLATDLCRDFRALGATVLGPAPTPFYALNLIGSNERRKLDAAVLDVRLHGAMVYEVADILQRRGIPMVFATASEKAEIPKRFDSVPVLTKPYERSDVVQAVMDLMQRPAPRPTRPLLLPTTDLAGAPPVIHFARALARALGALP
jgi:CheY-like chemotaxis protein